MASLQAQRSTGFTRDVAVNVLGNLIAAAIIFVGAYLAGALPSAPRAIVAAAFSVVYVTGLIGLLTSAYRSRTTARTGPEGESRTSTMGTWSSNRAPLAWIGLFVVFGIAVLVSPAGNAFVSSLPTWILAMLPFVSLLATFFVPSPATGSGRGKNTSAAASR